MNIFLICSVKYIFKRDFPPYKLSASRFSNCPKVCRGVRLVTVWYGINFRLFSVLLWKAALVSFNHGHGHFLALMNVILTPTNHVIFVPKLLRQSTYSSESSGTSDLIYVMIGVYLLVGDMRHILLYKLRALKIKINKISSEFLKLLL